MRKLKLVKTDRPVVCVLSGGEQAKVRLCKLINEETNNTDEIL